MTTLKCAFVACLCLNTPFRAQVPADSRAGTELERLTKACEAKDTAACFDLADLYFNGRARGWVEDEKGRALFRRGRAIDPVAALAMNRKACEASNAHACFRLGLLYSLSDSAEKQALQSWQQACAGGSPDGCFQVAWALDTGYGNSTHDPAEAAVRLKALCERGYAGACLSLGASYTLGSGVPPDHSQAAQLYEKACEAKLVDGCWNLAVALENGKGVLRDSAKAAQLYKTLEGACDSGVGAACVRLAKKASGAKDAKRLLQLAEKGCEAGDAVGCINAAATHREGKGLAKNPQKASALFERACVSGEDYGIAAGCAALGAMLANGEVGPPDLKRAVELFNQACAAGGWVGCLNLGVAYDKGMGVAKDKPRADKLFALAGKLGPEGLGRPYGLFQITLWSDEEFTTAMGKFNSLRLLR